VLASAADGLLTEQEQDDGRWATPPRSPRAARWSAADLWLLDEAAGLIERQGEYGHVVIDEAQDLSPMQARALARRCAHGSVTVLGDLAQGTSPWAASSWRDTMALLGKPDAEVVPLTTGFRVPSVVMDFANRLVPMLDVEVPHASSLRHDGSLDVLPVEDLAPATVVAAREALEHEGSIGIIVPDSLVTSTGVSLASSGLAWIAPDDLDREERITLVPATTAKGLEYDHVIVLEPSRIVAEETKGFNRLYVVLTRAVSRLVVLHHEPLPEALAA
jgi:DNA helicase IV